MTIQEFLKKAKVNDEYFPLFENGKLLNVNFDKKTKQYETKVYSLYTNATPFLMELQQ